MPAPTASAAPRTLFRRSLSALGRSLVVAVVAIGFFAFRRGYRRIDEIEEIIFQNATLGGVFIALFVWNFYFRRQKK
jgi:hypothetical protein